MLKSLKSTSELVGRILAEKQTKASKVVMRARRRMVVGTGKLAPGSIRLGGKV